jgi:DNA-binding PadR family transcriptional regulator
MMSELGRHGYKVGPGTMYPMLRQMVATGYLTVSTEVTDGRRLRVYRGTPAGRRSLAAARSKLIELVAEVVNDAPPVPSIHVRAGRRTEKARRGKSR